MIIEICLCLLAVFVYAYYEITKQFGFFKDRGIPYAQPSFPFGSPAYWKLFLGKISFTDAEKVDLAQGSLSKEKVVGAFALGQPTFIINDEELAKKVMIKDFEYFTDRRIFSASDEISKAFMLNLSGAEWKQMRSLMSGVFTSGKLKLMFPHLYNVGKNFEAYANKVAEEGIEVDMKEAGGKMTLDSIATAGFGIETNSFDDPENRFRFEALTLVGTPGYVSKFFMAQLLFALIFPRVAKFLRISFFPLSAVEFFSSIIRKTYRHRLQTGERRNDIIDLIIDEVNNSKNKTHDKQDKYESEFEKDAAIDTSGLKSIIESGFDEETLLISNAILFFFAGFDTSASGLAIIAHKLALYPEYQQRVFDEIEQVVGDEELTFAMLQDLKYMDKFISEAFRVNDVVTTHERLCTKDYKIPGTEFIIPKGRYVKIPVHEICVDPNNFYNPLEFDPENFDAVNKPNKFGSMIFGQGPRNCIGMRYALITIKVSIVCLLRKHQLIRSTRTVDRLLLDPSNPQAFKDGVFIRVTKRN